MNHKLIQPVSLLLVLAAFSLMAIGSGSYPDSYYDTRPSPVRTPYPQHSEPPGVTIQETALFSIAGVSATATEYVSDAALGDGIRLRLENNADVEVRVSCGTVTVNNYMTLCTFSCTMAPSETAEEVLYLDTSEITAAGIDNIGQLDIYFELFDSNDRYWGGDLAPVTLNTSAYDPLDMAPKEDGTELFNADGLKLILSHVEEEPLWGPIIVLYLENTAGMHLRVMCSQMTINGFPVDPYFCCDVYNGKRAVDRIRVFESDLTDNGIEAAEEITATFQVFLADSDTLLFETDPISFSIK